MAAARRESALPAIAPSLRGLCRSAPPASPGVGKRNSQRGHLPPRVVQSHAQRKSRWCHTSTHTDRSHPVGSGLRQAPGPSPDSCRPPRRYLDSHLALRSPLPADLRNQLGSPPKAPFPPSRRNTRPPAGAEPRCSRADRPRCPASLPATGNLHLLSQLSFSIYAGQMVFRAALQQNYDRGAWRHRGVSLMSLFSPESCCVSCVYVSPWELFCDRVSPLERQGTPVAAPPPPFFVFRFPRLRARCAL